MISLKAVLILIFLLIILIQFRLLWVNSSRNQTKGQTKEKECQLYLYYLNGTYKRSMTFKKQMLQKGFTFQWGRQTFAVTNVEELETEIKITAKEYE